jgi:general secretion pathway protein G
MRISAPRDGFTLIELMVVISIIGVLAALTVGVATVVQKQNRSSAAKATIQKLQLAFDMYRNHCGRYPLSPETHGRNEEVIGLLTGDIDGDGKYDPDGDDIPRNHRVWRGPYLPIDSANTDGSGNLLDPWGVPYRYYNNETEEPRFEVNRSSYLLYSCGNDGRATDSTRAEAVDWKLPHNKDNIKNWEEE